uniref:Uncharacterized protein n=1 Tax=Plectus sambesii TaxID=2011161 RepID=A0A914WJK9_9BILA
MKMCIELCVQYYNDPTTSISTVSYKKEMILPDALICLPFDEKEWDEKPNIHPTTPHSIPCPGYGKCDGSPAPQSNSGNGYGYGYQNGFLPETNAKISTPGTQQPKSGFGYENGNPDDPLPETKTEMSGQNTERPIINENLVYEQKEAAQQSLQEQRRE